MLRGPVADTAAVLAVAAIVTAAMAAPVLRAPSERVFGMEIVGRHHDPFTVMEQFGRPSGVGVYSQPVTDVAGALLARVAGPIAAYNWLVLFSFPLSAAAAYLLARHLAISRAGAAVAAMAYAFSPFHVAHAAYHPHIAQTQWMPLYLLALWRCLDHASPAAVAWLGAAAMAVTLSNFYGGLIAAVITPVAVAAYWLTGVTGVGSPFDSTGHSASVAQGRREPGVGPGERPMRRLAVTAVSLVLIAAGGMVYVSSVAPAGLVRDAFAFPRDALSAHSAMWWSYLVPPVEHPLLGAAARGIWTAADVREGLLEQQVSLGWGLVALGLVAGVWWVARERPPASVARVPVLALVAVAALLCSLSPQWTIGGFTLIGPSSILYTVAPMFRAYARFGVVVQLMAALLAGIGVECLRRAGTQRARAACLALVALAAGEYAVAPQALWRDVLPTTAHRWVTRQPGYVRVLDCVPLTQESASVRWLTDERVMPLGHGTNGCTDPNLSRTLVAAGYSHLLVRRESDDGRWYAAHPAPDGLRAAANLDDGRVFAVVHGPPIYTATTTGFFAREHDREWWWRWMGTDAAWTIVNISGGPLAASLDIEISAFHRARRLEVRLDGHPVETIVVEPPRRRYEIGPLAVPAGDHTLGFHPAEAPTVAGEVVGNGDPRRLSFALGTWNWSVRQAHP